MQEKKSIIVVWYKLKIPSLGITVWHHSASLAMANSYPHDRIFNPHLSTIQCANHFDHLGFLPKIATNHTVNLARSHTDT